MTKSWANLRVTCDYADISTEAQERHECFSEWRSKTKGCKLADLSFQTAFTAFQQRAYITADIYMTDYTIYSVYTQVFFIITNSLQT